MPLTKQQLLIPRVLCIGGEPGDPNYPYSTFLTGEILTYWRGSYFSKDNHEALSENAVNSFPHLFMSLHWYEERNIEDLPEFVKVIKTGEVKAVEKYEPEYKSVKFKEDEFYESLVMYQPADLSDYQEYQKQKEAK